MENTRQAGIAVALEHADPVIGQGRGDAPRKLQRGCPAGLHDAMDLARGGSRGQGKFIGREAILDDPSPGHLGDFEYLEFDGVERLRGWCLVGWQQALFVKVKGTFCPIFQGSGQGVETLA